MRSTGTSDDAQVWFCLHFSSMDCLLCDENCSTKGFAILENLTDIQELGRGHKRQPAEKTNSQQEDCWATAWAGTQLPVWASIPSLVPLPPHPASHLPQLGICRSPLLHIRIKYIFRRKEITYHQAFTLTIEIYHGILWCIKWADSPIPMKFF